MIDLSPGWARITESGRVHAVVVQQERLESVPSVTIDWLNFPCGASHGSLRAIGDMSAFLRGEGDSGSVRQLGGRPCTKPYCNQRRALL